MCKQSDEPKRDSFWLNESWPTTEYTVFVCKNFCKIHLIVARNKFYKRQETSCLRFISIVNMKLYAKIWL